MVKFLLIIAVLLMAFVIPAIENEQDQIYEQYGKDDENGTSFKGQIAYVDEGPHRCMIRVNNKWVDAVATVQRPAEVPTCLKKFFDAAHLPICGRPNYEKFKYCAKALLMGNRDYGKFKFDEEKNILILIDGCVRCMYIDTKAINVLIRLKWNNDELASTRTDLFSTFKIGALLSPKGKKPSTVFNNTFLEIEHQCNQYNMVQTLRVFLPYIEKRWLRWNTWESTGTLIPLDMGAKQIRFAKNLLKGHAVGPNLLPAKDIVPAIRSQIPIAIRATPEAPSRAAMEQAYRRQKRAVRQEAGDDLLDLPPNQLEIPERLAEKTLLHGVVNGKIIIAFCSNFGRELLVRYGNEIAMDGTFLEMNINFTKLPKKKEW